MFTNCANNPIYIPNGGECDDCSQLESRVDNLEEAMTEVQEELPDKQDKLTAGEGIFITPDGIISTTGSSVKVEITGNDPYYSSDKTFSEILTAYNNGDTIVANYQGTALPLQSISQTEAVFASTDSDGNITFFTITNGNDISSKTVDSVFLVTLTNPVGESGNKTYTSDRTLAEILEAIRNGSNVYATYSVANYPSYLALDWYTNDVVWFSSMSVDNASQQISAASVAQNRDYVATYHSVIHGVMQGASATRNGWSGIVPQPVAGDEEKFLKGDGTWAEVSGGCCAEEVSGNPIILTDAKNMNAQSLEVDFEPIQDLNGYDYAWAGGNGKNLLDMLKASYGGTASSVYYVDLHANAGDFNRIALTAGQTYTLSFDLTCNKYPCTVSAGCGNGDYSFDIKREEVNANGRVAITFTPTETQLTNRPYFAMRPVRYSSPETFTWSVANIQLELGSTATSFAPYENICPISGAESVTVKRTGKNLLYDTNNHALTETINGVAFVKNGDGSITINGTATANTEYYLSSRGSANSLVLSKGTYILSGIPTGYPSSYNLRLGVNRGNVGTTIALDTGRGVTFTDSVGGLPYGCWIAFSNGAVFNNTTIYPMIRPASISDDTYEPYNPQTVSINLGGEYYGGTLDFTTGELDVEWQKHTFVGDAYTETWWTEGYSGTKPDWPLHHSIRIPNLDTSTAPYCESFGTMVGVPSSTDLGFIGVRTTGDYPTLYVRTPEDYASINDWLAYLQANPITVVAKLKEPIKVQLVSAQLELLEKYNVLTTNGELITLSYMPDCYCGVTKTSQLLGLTHIMDGKANGSLRSNTAFPDGVIEQGGQGMDGTLGNFATALGAMTAATGMGAFAHGMLAMASGTCAHAEGARTEATGGGSHSEGEQTVASGARSHAEGLSNTASGSESHVGGALSEASAAGAFAHGQGLKASSPLQTVFGKYNVEDSNSEYAFIIGNGTSSNRSNLFAVKWDGTVEINGQALLPANGNSF